MGSKTGIAQVKAGVVEGVSAKRHRDGCLWYVFVVDRNLILALQEVQLAKDLCAMEIGDNISHVRQGVVVRFCNHIKAMVITAWSPNTIIFFDRIKGERLEGLMLSDRGPFPPSAGTFSWFFIAFQEVGTKLGLYRGACSLDMMIYVVFWVGGGGGEETAKVQVRIL